MLGDKDTGARVTELTLSIFMVDAQAIRPMGHDETRKGLSVRRGPAGGLHAPSEMAVSLQGEIWSKWY
jgi:hypothetical protein